MRVMLRSPLLRGGDRVQVQIVDGPTLDCAYEPDPGRWLCELPLPDGADRVSFVFRLDGEDQLADAFTVAGPNLIDPDACRFDGRDVRFPQHRDAIVDPAGVADRFFSNDPDESRRYDVIVVGSGAGGGTLAYQLAAGRRNGRPPRILLLEAGSYLFGTHTGNLPRYKPAGADEYHPTLFHGWRVFGQRRWRPADDTSEPAQIAQGLNLGGRTVYWGACAPRMRRWEFRDWPEVVADELLDVWYERAQQLMRVAPVPSSPYQTAVKATLGGLPALAGFRHANAPMAVEYTAPATGAVPAGIWSTAELLLHRALHRDRFRHLQINLNHEVVQVTGGAGQVDGVVAYDRAEGRNRTYRLADGGVVVLAAGTVGTANIAKLSGIADPAGMVGQGLTDHPIHVVKFWVPGGSRWYTGFESSKTLSRGPADPGAGATPPASPYNIMLELGADLNQFRFTDPADLTAADLATRPGHMPGELVFLVESPLVADNALTQRAQGPAAGWPADPPTIRIHPSPVGDKFSDEFDKITAEVLDAFDGKVSERLWAPPGGVSHEVGTMRMARTTPGRERAGVVDANLRVSGYQNLYACDLSVFPSSPAANPTLTLVALALRLSAHLAI